MGGEFGDEDERLITRLENSQFEPGDDQDHCPPQGHPGSGHPGPGLPPPGPDQFQSSPTLNSPWARDKRTPGPNDPLPEVKQEN